MGGYPYQDAREIPVRAFKLLADGTRQQVDLAFLENNEPTNGGDGNGALDGMWNPQKVVGGGREVLFILDHDYSDGTTPPTQNMFSDFKGVSYIFTPKRRSPTNPQIFRSGDRIYVSPTQSNDPGDTYRIDTGSLLVSVLDPPVPMALRLLPASPNPFNPTTTLRFQLPTAGRASLVVYDLLGRAVRRVFDGPFSAGDHAVSFTADGLPSGVYLVRLASGGHAETRRITLLR